MKVFTLGEIMMRLTPENCKRFVQADKFDVTFGGAEANVAVALSQWGIKSSVITKLPQHDMGQAAVNSLRKYGVDTDLIVRDGARIGLYYCEKGASQRASKVIYDRAEELHIEKVRKAEAGQPGTLYDYIPNMKYICDTVRMEHQFIQFLTGKSKNPEESTAYLSRLEDDCSRNTVPVRPGRHYKRWGRWMSSIPTAKFRIDGRRNPPIQKCFKTNGYVTIQG